MSVENQPTGNNTNTIDNKAGVPVNQTSTLSIVIKDKNVLYATYMGFVKPDGGLFIPIKKVFSPGDKLALILTIMDEERFEVTGKVNWVTPKGVHGARAPGVGVQFEGDNAKELNSKIQKLLVLDMQSDRPTYTM